MKPTFDIDPDLLDNRDAFTDAFFRRFQLRTAAEPLRLTDTIRKDYLFPTFYGDVTCAMAVFLCSAKAAEQLMPHPRLRPVRMLRGRSLVLFSCYEYRRVLGVAPYNEIAMTIPVMVDPLVNVPVLPALLGRFPSFGYHVFSMPVTSEENRIRGRRIWGLPKVVQEIDIVEQGGDCVTTCRDETGEPYFSLRVPTTGAPIRFDLSSHLYSRLGDRLLKSRTSLQALFHVTKNPRVILSRGLSPDREHLTLGGSDSARALRELEIEPCPLQLRFARGMNAVFDLPDPRFRPPFGW